MRLSIEQQTRELETLRTLLDTLGEVANRNGYLSGSMGPVTPDLVERVETRFMSVLARSEREGLRLGALLDRVLAGEPLPKFERERLVQVAVVLHYRIKAQVQRTPHAFGCYTDARRLLRRRYYAVQLDWLLTLLPEGFKLTFK